MNRLIIISCWLLISNMSIGQETMSASAMKQVNKLIEATLIHKENKVWKLLEKTYRASQIDFLKGNRTQLINELYSGNDLTGKWHNCKLENVQEMTLIDYVYNESGSYSVTYNVRCDHTAFDLTIELMKDGKKWKFVGASG